MKYRKYYLQIYLQQDAKDHEYPALVVVMMTVVVMMVILRGGDNGVWWKTGLVLVFKCFWKRFMKGGRGWREG